MEFWLRARRALDGLPGGAGLNIAHEAVDRHVAHGRGDREAFRFVDRDGGVQTITYGELAMLTARFASALSRLGVGPGDRVFLVAGRIPELYIAALGALKVKAIVSALFASFGPEPLRLRLNKAGARVLITTDALYRRRIAPIRGDLATVREIVVIGEPAAGTHAFSALMADAADRFAIPPTAPSDPAILHFTSGTTGSPKGALHAHEAVVAHHATAELALGLAAGDIFWCTADPGWVTGISYGLIAPLVVGATCVIDRGEFDAGRWYRIIEGQRVARWYTSPTALRMLMKAGTALARSFDLGSLKLVASAGEPLNPELVRWGLKAFGRPIHDSWWQTETGAIVLATPHDEAPVPGSIGRALPGFRAVVAERGGGEAVRPVGPGQEGELALLAGWPSMFRGYWDEPDRYARAFRQGYYLSGDLMRVDTDGRFWFVSRADEMIKSAGHLIGPFEIESVLLEHPAVAEAGVIGKPDPVTGEAVKAILSLRPGHLATDGLAGEILSFARMRLGPTLAPREIAFTADLPKTRSGKIMRRVLKARELGLPDPDPSTLDVADEEDAA
jgi:acetyl-CoA synthetase